MGAPPQPIELLTEIERLRHSRAIILATNDQTNPPRQIEEKDTLALYQCLRQLPPLNRLDLILHTGGGEVQAARKLVDLLRQKAAEVSVLIPYKARSAGALICLGANEVVMGPMSELSPIDPHIAMRGDFSGNGPKAISAEEVRLFAAMARDWFGVCDEDVAGLLAQREKALQTVGAMIETPAFYPYLSGRDNLYVMGNLRQKISKARLDEILDLVGLRPHQHKRFSSYSLGMKQRLAIGLTLLHHPRLLILDEPTNGLDPHGTVEVRRLILELSRQGHTIILCSHLLHEVEQVCNRLAILNQGVLVTEGAIEGVSQEASLEEAFLKLTELV